MAELIGGLSGDDLVREIGGNRIRVFASPMLKGNMAILTEDELFVSPEAHGCFLDPDTRELTIKGLTIKAEPNFRIFTGWF